MRSSGSSMGASPPVASRCGSSNKSCGRVIGAKGRPFSSKTALSAAALYEAIRARSSGMSQLRARTRSLLVTSRGSACSSASPKALQNTAHWVSLTTARKICSPSLTVKTSYTAQAEMRSGMGAAGWPVTANCIMCWATRKTLFSNSADCTCWPLPVTARWANAAIVPMAPNRPPMMSFTLLPARKGSPGLPVM